MSVQGPVRTGNLSTEKEAKLCEASEEEDEEKMAFYKRSSPAPQDERSGTSQQQDRTGAPQQHERTGTAYQAAGTPQRPIPMAGMPGAWMAELVLGIVTVGLGLIVAYYPTSSLTVVAVLLGVLMVVSGVYHVVRSLRRSGDYRMWGGIAGVLFFLTGIFLLRHVALTLAVIALLAGFAFIIAGIAALTEAISGDGHLGRAWSVLFGLICLFAGIAAITTPITTLTTLAIVLGWAFAAMGIMHIIGAIVSWRALRELPRGQVSVPGQRAAEPAEAESAYGPPSAESRAGDTGATAAGKAEPGRTGPAHAQDTRRRRF